MNEPSLNVQIWKSYVDEIDISLQSPSGVRVGPITEVLGTQRFALGSTEILLYYGEPSPYSVRQEIFLEFLPRQSYVDAGVWKIILTPRRIVEGQFTDVASKSRYIECRDSFSASVQSVDIDHSIDCIPCGDGWCL